MTIETPARGESLIFPENFRNFSATNLASLACDASEPHAQTFRAGCRALWVWKSVAAQVTGLRWFIFFLALFSVAHADDWLEFKNGERLSGHAIKTENGVITFQSTRFGELHVPVSEARVVPGEAPGVAPAVLAEAASMAILKLLTPETTAAPPALAAAPSKKWKGRIDTLLDYLWSTGLNSRETRVQANAERLSGHEHYTAYANLDYLYNQNVLVQNRREGKFTWEHQLSKTLYSITEPDYLHEIRQNAIDQYQLRTGLGAQLFQTDRSQVRLAALAYFSRLDIPATNQRFEDVYPTLRLDSKWEIIHGLKFEQEGNAFYIPRQNTAGVDDKLSLVKDIVGGITLTLQHEYHHEEIPNASTTRNELKLLLGYAF